MTLSSNMHLHPSHPGTVAGRSRVTMSGYHTIIQVTPCSGTIKTMNHTGKEGESKQAVGNRRQQQITDKLYCTFVYSRTDKNFEFIQNWLLNAFSISKLEFPRFVFDTLKSLSFCGCHKNIFFAKDPEPFLCNYSCRHSFCPWSCYQLLNRCYIEYKCFIKSADDKSTICAEATCEITKRFFVGMSKFSIGVQ